MESDYCQHIKRCLKCQVYADNIHVAPSFLHNLIALWASNEHRIQSRRDQLNLIEEKWLMASCHGQLYQKRIKSAFNKKVRPHLFKEGDLVLRKILPNTKDSRGKWTPIYEGPHVVKRTFSRGALILIDLKGHKLIHPINVDTIKLFYPCKFNQGRIQRTNPRVSKMEELTLSSTRGIVINPN
ncbi:hypothetical protein CR513_10243, partial [Mucuna pruriens]